METACIDWVGGVCLFVYFSLLFLFILLLFVCSSLSGVVCLFWGWLLGFGGFVFVKKDQPEKEFLGTYLEKKLHISVCLRHHLGV